MSTPNIDQNYPFIVQEVMKHIEAIKKIPEGRDTPLIDIIFDYCFKNSIDVEIVGDAIASDVYFKSFIEKDCELHRIFRPDADQVQLEDW
jgi:hypothetical protein